jgi:hypothetical protein
LDTRDWLERCLQGYAQSYDHDFQLALNIELELILSAETPDEALRPLRALTRWFEILREANSAKYIRQLIRAEAPGTWYVDKDDWVGAFRDITLSDDMRRFLVDFNARIKSEIFMNLKKVMKSQHSI